MRIPYIAICYGSFIDRFSCSDYVAAVVSVIISVLVVFVVFVVFVVLVMFVIFLIVFVVLLVVLPVFVVLIVLAVPVVVVRTVVARTAGIIMGRSGIRAAYATGRGKITLRGRAEIVEKKNGRGG